MEAHEAACTVHGMDPCTYVHCNTYCTVCTCCCAGGGDGLILSELSYPATEEEKSEGEKKRERETHYVGQGEMRLRKRGFWGKLHEPGMGAGQ